MRKEYDVVIIGAGPAGLMAGLTITNKKVLILEKNSTAGRKLLISGAGQCNYTNWCNIEEFLDKYKDKGKFLKHAIYSFTNKDAVKFFETQGVDSIIRDDNKVFPKSLSSSDILMALVQLCQKLHHDIALNEAAESITYDEEKEKFTIITNKNLYISKYLVITTGGRSYPQTGSTGDGYNMAKTIGHKIEKISPSLTPIYVHDYEFQDLSGISFENIKVALWRNNKKIKEFAGDILLTHKNFSGPIIINNSSYMEPEDELKINFTKYKNHEEFKRYFEQKISQSGKLNVKTVIKDLDLPKRFIDKIMQIAMVNEDISCSQLDKKSRNKIVELLSAYTVKIKALGDYNIAMATKGGVSTKEISQKTMESKLIKNLYFAGEVIDIDGDTGGYNIQAALSTGRLAGKSISQIM